MKPETTFDDITLAWNLYDL